MDDGEVPSLSAPTTLDHLVAMANQIGTFFASKPHEQGVREAADHIRQFWDPRMRKALSGHLQAGGQGLAPLALEAAWLLERQPHPPHDPANWTDRDALQADAG